MGVFCCVENNDVKNKEHGERVFLTFYPAGHPQGDAPTNLMVFLGGNEPTVGATLVVVLRYQLYIYNCGS
jgi:hypothetical protein